MNRKKKGDFGYLSAKRLWVIIRTIIYFILSLSIFLIGYFTTHNRQNLLTIIAVLGCLPACKSVVSTIMYIKAKGCSKDAQNQIMHEIGNLSGLYDMYFTSYKKNFDISHLVIKDNSIIAYTEDSKCDLQGAKEHLLTMLKQGGVKDYVISITNDISKYCQQLARLQEKNEENSEDKTDCNIEVITILKEISL